MARYKAYDYNQSTMILVSLCDQLEPGTLEHTIHYVVEVRLDLTSFDLEYCNDYEGRPAYDPRLLLKVILLGYSRAMLSSRKPEAACKDNISFMALTCGQTPDHSTIAEFVSGMGALRISEIFAQVLLVSRTRTFANATRDLQKQADTAEPQTSASKEDCERCKLRTQCLRNPGQNNPVQVRLFNGRVTESITSAMKEKIDTVEGRKFYGRRLGIVEPVFANIAAQKGMNRSTPRGIEKVNIQWKLYGIVHNLEKIAKYGYSTS